MTDKEIIRAEIERRYNERDRIGDNVRANVHKSLISFIDSMQEEPVSIDFEQELYKAFGQVKDFTLCMRIAKRFYDIGKNSQEPVGEDLEQASKEWLKPQLDKSYADYGETNMMELTHFDGYAMLDAIEFGAKWQKKRESILSKDLEELINSLSKRYPEVSFAKLSRIAVRVVKWQEKKDRSTIKLAEDHATLAGMKKMKEQMMANAIDAVISQVPCSNEIILYNPSSVDKYYLPQEMNKLGLNKGDKVKLVIIKED